jgi:hypothetical protein
MPNFDYMIGNAANAAAAVYQQLEQQQPNDTIVAHQTALNVANVIAATSSSSAESIASSPPAYIAKDVPYDQW